MKQRKINNYIKGALSINLFPQKIDDKEIKLNLVSDEEALASDWLTTGNDLRTVIDKVKEDDGYKDT